MKKVDIVVPCFNEESCIEELFRRVQDVFSEIPAYSFSFIFVDDGSRDRTLDILKDLKKKHPENVDYISFSGNFGKEAAILSGMRSSKGDIAVLMDADLQHPPELIKDMLKALEDGYEMSGARRSDRKGEPPLRSLFSIMYYRLINHFTSMHLEGGSDYRMLSGKARDALLSFPERIRYTRGILSITGYKTKWIDYENAERFGGKTKWSFKSLLRYAFSGFLSFSYLPLRIPLYLGLFLTAISIVGSVWLLYSGGSLLTGLLLFLSAIQMLFLGILGEYIRCIYTEIKGRPVFIEKENTMK